MAADPDAAELAAMDDVKAVMKWAGFDETKLGTDTEMPGSFLKHLGVQPTTLPRVIGIFEDKDLHTMLNTWKAPDPAAGGPRVPNMGEAGMAKLFFRACQLKAGMGVSIAELKAKASAPPPSPTVPATSTALTSPTKKVKLSSILSQVDDTELMVDSEADIVKCYARFENVYGQGERPAKDCEPTAEQITGLRFLCEQNSPPYADFAVFGPFGHRMVKRIKLSGYTIDREGGLKTTELYGPGNVGAWLQSYGVLKTILIMLDQVDLGHLQKYEAHIERLAARYGPRVWSVIYQGDVRCRLEHMERLRRSLKAEHDRIKAAGGTSDYDEKRPWNQVWAKAAADETFWREEVIEPCMLILTKIANTAEVLEGDAKVNQQSQQSAGQRETTPAPSRMASGSVPDRHTHRPRNSNRTGRIHDTDGNKYVRNRTGYSICAGYNSGTCTEASQGPWCRHQWDTVHQCDRCLGNHPSSKCPHGELQTPGFVKNAAKGGKSRGKGGRGGKGKRPPY